MAEELELALAENAEDFLQEAVKYAKASTPRDWKYAVQASLGDSEAVEIDRGEERFVSRVRDDREECSDLILAQVARELPLNDHKPPPFPNIAQQTRRLLTASRSPVNGAVLSGCRIAGRDPALRETEASHR
jgi:hypothetical protein